MDFATADLSRLSISDGAVDVELRPIYDPALRVFSAQLWVDGDPRGWSEVPLR